MIDILAEKEWFGTELFHTLQGTTDVSSLFDLEEMISGSVNRIFGHLMATIFEAWDEKLVYECLADGEKRVNKQPRTISFVHGDVTYQHTTMRTSEGKNYFPLDEAMEMRKNRRVSPYLEDVITQLAGYTTFGTAAKLVELMTATMISKQAVSNIVRRVGTQQSNTVAVEAKDVINNNVQGHKCLEYLYLEADAFMIKHYRRNKDTKKTEHIEVFQVQVYEGVEKHGKRRTLIGRKVFTGVDETVVKREVTAYIQATYDLSATTVFTGSDNGPGFTAGFFSDLIIGSAKVEHYLDHYHLHKKIKDRLGWTNPINSEVIKAVDLLQKDGVHDLLNLEKVRLSQEGYDITPVSELAEYLHRNWQYIATPKQRKYKHAAKLGSVESNHRSYTYRLKKQGKSWSKDGLIAMLAILDAKVNGVLRESVAKIVRKNYEVEMPVLLTPLELMKHSERDLNRIVKQRQTVHLGALNGFVTLDGPTSSPIGHLAKAFK
jgi:hypothetical protein